MYIRDHYGDGKTVQEVKPVVSKYADGDLDIALVCSDTHKAYANPEFN